MNAMTMYTPRATDMQISVLYAICYLETVVL